MPKVKNSGGRSNISSELFKASRGTMLSNNLDSGKKFDRLLCSLDLFRRFLSRDLQLLPSAPDTSCQLSFFFTADFRARFLDFFSVATSMTSGTLYMKKSLPIELTAGRMTFVAQSRATRPNTADNDPNPLPLRRLQPEKYGTTLDASNNVTFQSFQNFRLRSITHLPRKRT